MLGVVKFFKSEKGWGAVTTPDLDADVWVHFSTIETDGYRDLAAGDVVEFEVEEVQQDRFRYRTTQARRVGGGPAPTLRRRGDEVVIAPAGTPDTPLTPRAMRRPAAPRD